MSKCIFRKLKRHDGANYAVCKMDGLDCDNGYWDEGAPKYCRQRLKQSPGIAK